MYYVSRFAALIAIAALLAAAWFSIRLAQAGAAFRQGTPESVARAAAIMPRDIEYLSFRALQLDYDGADSTAILRRIAALAPLSSAPRIRLGLDAEVRGDFDSAERWLLDAARIDRQFEPRWTLANYYLRRGNAAAFWRWMREALLVSYGDRRPAFDLCWRESADAKEILTLAIPPRHEVLTSYLAYLLQEHRLSAALPVALQLAASANTSGDANDRLLLFSACDAFIDAQDSPSAGALWRAMGYPFPQGIASADWETSATGHGFDWRAPDVPGAVHLNLEAPPAHRIALNGSEPESCELLRRFVGLHARTRYVLRWEARTPGLNKPGLSKEGPASLSGLEWRIAGHTAAVAPSDDWRAGEFAFEAPGDLAALTLVYQRPSGQPRAEGSVELRQVTIVEAK